MKKLTAYISGPMRGLPAFNFPAFFAEEERVRARLDYEVLNPARHDINNGFDPKSDTIERFDIHSAFRWDVRSILACDLVVVLPGWEKSAGATLEVSIARAVGADVYRWDELRGRYVGVPDEAPVAPPPPAPAGTVLEEAQRIIFGARNEQYGHPGDDFARAALMFSAILGVPVEAHTVAMLMIALKLSRLVHGPHRDSVVDIAGYAGCMERVLWEERA